MTDDLFAPLTPANPGAPPPRKCKHLWVTRPDGSECQRCGKPYDETAGRRGFNNRHRGNAIEREIGKKLGLRRVGQYGGPDDLSGEMFAAQVKSGGSFSERLWGWLKAVPVKAGQTAILVVADTPGPGHRRRVMVMLDIDDWIDLHGGTE